MNALFAERAKLDREYRELGAATEGNPGPPVADKLERLKDLWENIFPERRLVIADHAVRAKPVHSDDEYPASSLSDGERVGFYLVGHALLAPTDARLVIDEPELHLHESIQSRLWDAVEAARQDCLFIYITHDLGFAASRVNATKVVLYDYLAPNAQDGVGSWDWQTAPDAVELPEDVVLRILGSRRPTLFVEGRTGSLDQAVYEGVLPEAYVIPSGGWDSVVRSVKVFRDQPSLHHFSVAGIIDKDDRSNEEIRALRSKGVHVLPVAAIENALVLPFCLDAFLDARGIPKGDRPKLKQSAMENSVEAMRRLRDQVIAERAQYGVRRRIGAITRVGDNRDDLIAAVDRVAREADPGGLYDEAETAIDNALGANVLIQAYLGVLSIFRNKSLIQEVTAALNVDRQDYIEGLVSLVISDGALRKQLQTALDLDHLWG